MKIMSINAGSSSLKFSLFNMDSEEVIASGLFERIGIEQSCYTIKYNGEKLKQEVDLPDHSVAVSILLEKLVEKGDISAGHARAVLSLKTEKKQIEAAQKIIALGLSVRQAELLAKRLGAERKPEKKKIADEVDYTAEAQKELSSHLGRGVKIVNGRKKGRIELEYYGMDDLNELLEALALLKVRKAQKGSKA